MGLRETLDELKWRDGVELSKIEFVIVDRAAPGGERVLGGDEVEGRDRSYLHLSGGGRVPFHRVVEVRVDGLTRWRKEGALRG